MNKRFENRGQMEFNKEIQDTADCLSEIIEPYQNYSEILLLNAVITTGSQNMKLTFEPTEEPGSFSLDPLSPFEPILPVDVLVPSDEIDLSTFKTDTITDSYSNLSFDIHKKIALYKKVKFRLLSVDVPFKISISYMYV